jgi:BirA family biotin operon repressor/biotin-[acetyl-CoA-carboxylase] ligase
VDGGVVVGLGLNVDWAGTPLPPGGTSLAEAGAAGAGLDRTELLVAYLVGLEARWRQSPNDLMTDYRASCSTIGRQVRVELPGGATLEGLATGVADDGRLLVDGRTVAAGDVVHVR